jgi:hypothetical protein
MNKQNFILQSWGDHADESQAAFVYFFAVGNMSAYCWLGNELSEQVRKIIFSNQASYLTFYLFLQTQLSPAKYYVT